MTRPLQSIAGDGVAHRQGEEDEAKAYQDDVHHLRAPNDRRFGRSPTDASRQWPSLMCIEGGRNP
jgi:excinuclease UvrABC nuclease subunit